MISKSTYMIFPIIAAFLAGISYNVVEILINTYNVNEIEILIFGNLIAGLFILPFVKNKIQFKQFFNNRKNLILLIVASLTTFALAYLAIYSAIGMIGSSKSSFIISIEPLFIAALAFIFLKEKLSKKDIAGAALMIFGALIINFDFTHFKFIFGLGELLAILAPLLFAIGIVITTNLLKRLNILGLTSFELIFGSLSILIFGLITRFNFKVSVLIFALLILISILVTFNWLTYNKGLKYIGASLTSILYSSKAFFTLLISLIFVWLIPNSGIKIPKNLITMIMGGLILVLGLIIIKKGKK